MKKFMKTIASGVVLSCSSLAATYSFAGESALENILNTGELKVCFEAGYMPFEMKTKDGRFIGFDIDL